MIDNPPETLEDALCYLLDHTPREDQQIIANCKTKDRCGVLCHHGFGTWVRNSFGLWGENKKLIKDLQKKSDRKFTVVGDDACSIILDKLWERLRGENE